MGNANRKHYRMMDMLDRFRNEEVLEKSKLMEEYGVEGKTVQRDIEDLRTYFSEKETYYGPQEIIYDKSKRGYVLKKSSDTTLNEKEVQVIIKILLESRAFNKKELDNLIFKLLRVLPKESNPKIKDITSFEVGAYKEPQHKKYLIETIWQLSETIRKARVIKFDYSRMDGKKSKKIMKPVSILFNEFYFYLVAYAMDSKKDEPIILRIDRMSNIEYTKEEFRIEYKDKLDEGEFRKRLPFMYGGKLQKIKFKFWGPSLEAVLDKLPTAEVIGTVFDEKLQKNIYTIKVEVYGETGINMWLGSQGEYVEVLEK